MERSAARLRSDDKLHDPETKVMLIMCARVGVPTYGVAPVDIPSLSSRMHELPQIIDDYFDDARIAIGQAQPEDLTDYRDWILAREATSHKHIEQATTRLLALHRARTIYGAAKLIGITRQSMSTWIEKHGLPERLQRRLDEAHLPG